MVSGNDSMILDTNNKRLTQQIVANYNADNDVMSVEEGCGAGSCHAEMPRRGGGVTHQRRVQ